MSWRSVSNSRSQCGHLSRTVHWVNFLQKFSGVFDLMVFLLLRLLGLLCSKSLLDIRLAYFFKIPAAGQNVPPKTLPVIGPECIRIGDEPRFHRLNHEVDQCRLSDPIEDSIRRS